MNFIPNGRNWSTHVADPVEDRELILRGRKLFFDHPEAEAYVEWLYYNNPAGPLYAAFALEGETIAGQYIVVPTNFLVNGKQAKAAIGVDLFTNLKYRYQGVYTALAQKLHGRLVKDKILFILAIANNNSQPASKGKVGFIEPNSTYAMVRPISPTSEKNSIAGKISTKIPFGLINNVAGRLKGLQIDRTDYPDRDDLDNLWKNLSGQITFGIVKDASWVYWRYLDNPYFSYRFLMGRKDGRLVGYLVWNKTKILKDNRGYKSIILMDFVALDSWTAISLIQAFIEEVAADVHYAKAQTVLFSKECFWLLMAGFFPVKPKSVVFKILDQKLFNIKILRNLQHGYSMSDTN